MARTIGRKNINLVKRLTKKAIKKRKPFSSMSTYVGIEEEVIAELPEKLFDIWEMAYQEIVRIIDDTIYEED